MNTLLSAGCGNYLGLDIDIQELVGYAAQVKFLAALCSRQGMQRYLRV